MRDRVGRFFGLRSAVGIPHSALSPPATSEGEGTLEGSISRAQHFRSWVAVLVLKGGLALGAAWMLAALVLLVRLAYRLA
jgi:hypothetical protein